jgi:hypothetical protein
MSIRLPERPSAHDAATVRHRRAAGQPSPGGRLLLRWLLPLALLVMVVELVVVGRLLLDRAQPRGEVAGLTRAALTAVPPAPAPTQQPAAAPAAPPSAAAAPAAPPSAAAAPAAPPSAAAPTPAPTSLPAATAAAPAGGPPQQSRPQPGLSASPPPSAALGPATTVERFYVLVDQGQYEAAAQLWSTRMRTEYPPAANINDRFAQTDSLTLRSSDVRWVDAAGGRAEVAIDLTEVVGGRTRRWVGSWHLVQGPRGWLLDAPSIGPG